MDLLTLVFCGVTAAVSVFPYVKYFTETWLMGNITLLDFIVLLFLIGYYGLALCFICKAGSSLIYGMTPVNKFKQVNSEIELEWQCTNNDNDINWLDVERSLGEIYWDRERLSLKLKRFQIFSPDPKDPRNWKSFIQDLSPLSEEGRLDEARRRYGDPKQFD